MSFIMHYLKKKFEYVLMAEVNKSGGNKNEMFD